VGTASRRVFAYSHVQKKANHATNVEAFDVKGETTLSFKLKKCAIVCEDHVGGLTGVVLAIIAAPVWKLHCM